MDNAFKPMDILCERCKVGIEENRFNTSRRCTYCKGQLLNAHCVNCHQNSENTNVFDEITPLYHYDGLIKTMIHQYKFLKDIALAQVFSYYLTIPFSDYDVIIPIPSVPSNDVERTFNPVATILEMKGLQYSTCLKMYDRPKQYQLSLNQRKSASNPMYFKDEINLENKTILLIDDIYTTGSTAHHAGKLLKSKKIRKLNMLTFAR